MKTYRISRMYLWPRVGAKLVLTALAVLLYVLAVTHPTPLPVRLMLLSGLTLFGWLFYVRLPKIPTQITVAEDGWVDFQSRKNTTRVRATEISSIDRSFGRGKLRFRHEKGTLTVPNRFGKSFDLLLTLKGMNPALDVRGF